MRVLWYSVSSHYYGTVVIYLWCGWRAELQFGKGVQVQPTGLQFCETDKGCKEAHTEIKHSLTASIMQGRNVLESNRKLSSRRLCYSSSLCFITGDAHFDACPHCVLAPKKQPFYHIHSPEALLSSLFCLLHFLCALISLCRFQVSPRLL